jgi:hypothetical protein
MQDGYITVCVDTVAYFYYGHTWNVKHNATITVYTKDHFEILNTWNTIFLVPVF